MPKVMTSNSKVVEGPTILLFAKGMLSELKTYKRIFNGHYFSNRDSADKKSSTNKWHRGLT